MAPKKTPKPAKDSLTEASIRIGKALGKTSAQLEASGRKAKKTTKNLVASTVKNAEDAVEQTIKKVTRLTTPESRGKSKEPLFMTNKAMTVEANIGFLAGDIYGLLTDKGPIATSELVRVMQKRGNTEAYICAALGWLSREYKIRFIKNGMQIGLAD